MKQRKFILVGAGGFREFWEEIFIPKMKDFAVPVAAVDVSEEALKLPVKYGTVPAEKCYTDPRTAIEENPCDFLVLMIPPRARMQYIDLAVEYGLDVVCEKPLADTMEHACEIYVKMRDAGLKVSVTYGTVIFSCQRTSEGCGSYDSISVGRAGTCVTGHTHQACPAEYVPLLFISFSGVFFGV